jgi:predicted nucleotidyltransferase
MRKLRNTGTPIDVDEGLRQLDTNLGELPGLVAAYVYGSYGTPDQTPLSDIDLALVFEPARVPGSDEHLRLIGRIMEILGEEDCSVTLLNSAPPIFQFRVLETGRLLFCRDEAALADFVAGVLSRHADFMIDHQAFLEEYDAALVEEYGNGD